MTFVTIRVKQTELFILMPYFQPYVQDYLINYSNLSTTFQYDVTSLTWYFESLILMIIAVPLSSLVL